MTVSQPVTGLVVAAGSSRRLGQPKQLLAYRGRTLLDASLNVARDCSFAQRLVTVGGAGARVRTEVDFDGFGVVESLDHTQGCSSSIVAALDAVPADSQGIVMLLGDQPGIDPHVVDLVIQAGLSGHPLAVCRYDDGIGHPFWFGRAVFDDLRTLHGDKAVWKLIESGRHRVCEVRIAGPVPLDVDTWDDYQALLAQDGASAPTSP